MSVPKFAILDVETTSGDPTVGRVMEVAVLAYDGDQERLRWETLVDPRTKIPPFIVKLTGITQEMINTSPTFPMVVRTLQTLTQDRIVVAHNVRYDMTSLEHEFARTGLLFDRGTLCTEPGRSGRRSYRSPAAEIDRQLRRRSCAGMRFHLEAGAGRLN